MSAYSELVKKAREMHARLGEKRFRELYEKYPAVLMTDMGVRAKSGMRSHLGTDVLQSFHFYPLQEKHQSVYDLLLERRAEVPLKASELGFKRTAVTLRILEARGLIRVRAGKMGRSRNVLIVEEIR